MLTFGFLVWDHRDTPEAEELDSILREINGSTCCFQVETGADFYLFVIAQRNGEEVLTKEEWLSVCEILRTGDLQGLPVYRHGKHTYHFYTVYEVRSHLQRRK